MTWQEAIQGRKGLCFSLAGMCSIMVRKVWWWWWGGGQGQLVTRYLQSGSRERRKWNWTIKPQHPTTTTTLHPPLPTSPTPVTHFLQQSPTCKGPLTSQKPPPAKDQGSKHICLQGTFNTQTIPVILVFLQAKFFCVKCPLPHGTVFIVVGSEFPLPFFLGLKLGPWDLVSGEFSRVLHLCVSWHLLGWT